MEFHVPSRLPGSHRGPQNFLFIDMCHVGALRDFFPGVSLSDQGECVRKSMSSWGALQGKCLCVIDMDSGKDLESTRMLLCPLPPFVPRWTLQCHLMARGWKALSDGPAAHKSLRVTSHLKGTRQSTAVISISNQDSVLCLLIPASVWVPKTRVPPLLPRVVC